MWERGHISRSSRSTSGAGRAEHTRSQAGRVPACVCRRSARPGPALRQRGRGGGEHVCLGVGGRRRRKAISPTTTLPSLSLSLRKVSPPTFSPPFSLYPPRVPAIVWGSLFSTSFSHVWGSKSKKGPFLLPPEMDRRTLHLQCTCCALLIYCCTAATLNKKAKILLSTASCSSPPD